MQAKIDIIRFMVSTLMDCGYYSNQTEGYKALERANMEINKVLNLLVEEEDNH